MNNKNTNIKDWLQGLGCLFQLWAMETIVSIPFVILMWLFGWYGIFMDKTTFETVCIINYSVTLVVFAVIGIKDKFFRK